jgi:hypothetical protein
MYFLSDTNWVLVSQKSAIFIVTAGQPLRSYLVTLSLDSAMLHARPEQNLLSVARFVCGISPRK